MHAVQFVQEFSTFTGQDYASLRVVDRALAEAGLRRKASGRRLPDFTLAEGVLFLLAVLANTQPTRAAEAAEGIAAFRLIQGPEYKKDVLLLARTMRLPVAAMSNLILFDAVTTICADLPNRKDAFAELQVDRDGAAFLQLWKSSTFRSDGPASLPFVGGLSTRRPKILTETRKASTDLLRWIGENTVHEPAEVSR